MEIDGQTIVSPPPFVEVELVYEPGRPGISGKGWCALQLWTKNHIYDVDWSMQCFAVADRATGTPIEGHRLIGAHLTGGQLQEGERLELTYPLPKPGVSAVFEMRGEKSSEYTTTSAVRRVILRLRVLSVSQDSANPQWKELSSSFAAQGPRGTRPGH